MRQLTRLVVLFACPALALQVAGCQDAGDAEPPLEPAPTATLTPGPGATDGTVQPLLRPVQAVWTSCHGLSAQFVWPLDTNPGTSFPGWEPAEDITTSGVYMMGWECERFSFGVVERGPIRFLLETHNYFEVPDACRAAQGPISYWILQSIWTDDAEVAGLLGQAEGMPSYAATITASDEAAGPGFVRSWTWAAEGTGTSELQVPQGPEPRGSSALLPRRTFWPNDVGGISFIDLTFAASSALGPPGIDVAFVSERPSTGTMQEPMLMAAAGEQFVGSGSILEDGEFAGGIDRYGDLQCDERL